MNGKNSMVVVALVAMFVMSFGFVSTASAAGTVDDLLAQIAALQQQLQNLQNGDGSPTTPPTPVLPLFQSHGNVAFKGGTGNGWWSLDQYEDRASASIGAYSTERIIEMNKSLVVDKYDPSRFMFNLSIRTLSEATPTGRLNFSSYSSCGQSNLSARVYDQLQDVWIGWDEENQQPVYRQEMWANLTAGMNLEGQVLAFNDSVGRWTSEWYNGEGNLYFSQSGDEFRVDGYGKFTGDNPAAVGAMMVEQGFATYGTVPEPATMAFLAIGAMGIIARRRNRQ